MSKNLAIILTLALLTACGAGKKPENAEPPAAKPKVAESDKDSVTLKVETQASIGIKVEAAKVQALSAPLELTASVQPNETRSAHLRPLSRGQVRRVEVRKGDRVRAGQSLLVYDNADVIELIGDYRSAVAILDKVSADAEQTRKSVDVAGKAVDAAKQSLTVSRKTVEAARKTAEVARKTAEVAQRNTEVARKTADGARKTAEATQQAVDVSRKSLERGESLVGVGAVSKAEIERRSADYKNAEASKRAAESSTMVAEASMGAAVASASVAEASTGAAEATADVAEASTGAADASVTSALAAMAMAQGGMVVAQASIAVAQADVDKIVARLSRLGPTSKDLAKIAHTSGDGADLAYTNVRAPFDGIVMDVDAAEGESIAPAEILMTITDISTVWVLADAYERDLGVIRAGQDVDVLTDAYPNQVFRGRVTYVGDTLDPQTRTTKIRCEVANPGDRLKLEMFARIRLHTASVRSVLAVPETAIQTIDDKSVVFTRKDDSVFVRNEVQLGARGGSMVEIRSGLDAGAMVVTEGSFALKSALLKDRIGEDE